MRSVCFQFRRVRAVPCGVARPEHDRARRAHGGKKSKAKSETNPYDEKWDVDYAADAQLTGAGWSVLRRPAVRAKVDKPKVPDLVSMVALCDRTDVNGVGSIGPPVP